MWAGVLFGLKADVCVFVCLHYTLAEKKSARLHPARFCRWVVDAVVAGLRHSWHSTVGDSDACVLLLLPPHPPPPQRRDSLCALTSGDHQEIPRRQWIQYLYAFCKLRARKRGSLWAEGRKANKRESWEDCLNPWGPSRYCNLRRCLVATGDCRSLSWYSLLPQTTVLEARGFAVYFLPSPMERLIFWDD